MPDAGSRQRLHTVTADAADAEYSDMRIGKSPHAVLAEDELRSYKSLIYHETIFLTSKDFVPAGTTKGLSERLRAHRPLETFGRKSQF